MAASSFRSWVSASVFLACVANTVVLLAQQPTAVTTVPNVMWFSGTFRPANGLPIAPVEVMTFAIYHEQEGGTPSWEETQNVVVRADGRYDVLLGSTTAEGLPRDLFATGDPRWMGVRVIRTAETEQPRVALTSVPYALKAADADTLGGLPVSAFLLAPTGSASTTEQAAVTASTRAANTRSNGALTPLSASTNALLGGTPNFVAKYATTTDIGPSALFENNGLVGLGTTTPFDLFHVRFTNTTGSLTGLAVQNLGTTATSYSGMLFYDQNGALGQFQGFNNVTHEYRINNIAKTGATFDGSINFMLGGASKFIIGSSGRVGISSPSPSAKLEVIDQSNFGLRVQTNTPGGAVASFGPSGEFQVDLPFIPGGRFEVTESGRVGIGRRFPSFQLHVTDPSNSGLRVETSTAGGTVASFGGAGDFQIDANGVAAGRFVVKENGSVGIGLPNPGQKLSVAGTVQSTSGGFMFPDGTVQVTATTSGISAGLHTVQREYGSPGLQLTSTGWPGVSVVHLTLPAGTYLLSATLLLDNRANQIGQNNSRDFQCYIAEDARDLNAPLFNSDVGGGNLLTFATQRAMSVTSGADVLCGVPLGSLPTSAFIDTAVMTALQILGAVDVQ